MDLNGDGNIDILSGSYSRQTSDMAGLFQVLYGTDDGGFEKPAILNGTDGEPLIVPASQEKIVDKICTRPTAVDLDNDGHLDIVTGNFGGTFYLFKGTGTGEFSPTCTKLTTDDGDLSVPFHSDPFFVDWDEDGDMDMLSGSAKGGVYLAMNEGSPTEPKFAKPDVLIKPVDAAPMDKIRLGDEFLTQPQGSTRVYADDVNGDGKLDLLVGDSVTLYYPGEGVDEDAARAGYKTWMDKQSTLMESYPMDGEEEAVAKWTEGYEKLIEERDEIVRVEMTGFVWVYHRK